jgi:hypothetical protein
LRSAVRSVFQPVHADSTHVTALPDDLFYGGIIARLPGEAIGRWSLANELSLRNAAIRAAPEIVHLMDRTHGYVHSLDVQLDSRTLSDTLKQTV